VTTGRVRLLAVGGLRSTRGTALAVGAPAALPALAAEAVALRAVDRELGERLRLAAEAAPLLRRREVGRSAKRIRLALLAGDVRLAVGRGATRIDVALAVPPARELGL
jgi:hypothetical protein